MTVSIITSRADYTGNSVTTAFTVPFYFLDNTHLLVLRTQISTNVTTTLALTTDFTVTGAGVSAGGTLTMVTAPTADQKLSILRNVPFTQLTHYVENDPFPAASHEQALDKLTMEVQQLNEAQSRALTLSQASTGVSAALPNPTANLVLAWNSAANALINVDASTLASSIVYGSTATQNNSGNGVQTQFTLGSNGTNVANVQAYISGVRQRPNTDYTLATDGVTLNFTTAPASGTNNILFVWQQALPIAQIADNTVTTAKLVDASVTTVKHADASVTAAKLASGAAVSNIGTGGITANELASSSVTAAKIASGAAVSNIGAGGISSNELAANAVTAAKIASGAAVSNIGAGGITSNELAANAVTTAKITDANVTAAKLAAGAAVSNVGAGGITANELASNAVTYAKLASDVQGALYGFKNRIINGAMMIDQRNAGASVTQSTTVQYPVDRMQIFGDVASKFTGQQSTTGPAGFINSLKITSSSAYTVGAGERFFTRQAIEGLNCADLDFGKATAKTVTVSFWVYSSLTGTFGGSVQNGNRDRSYPFSYTINSANTWEQKSITVAGDTTGTWATDVNVGIYLNFGLGVGSTYSGTAGAWAGANYASVTGAVSVVGTNAATFYITGVQLEKGSTATSFDYRPYGTELMLCQRYYAKLTSVGLFAAFASGYVSSSTGADLFIKYPVSMRAAATVNYNTVRINTAAATPAVTSIGGGYSGSDSAFQTFTASGGLTTGQGCLVVSNNSTSGYIDLSAEL